jgi:ribonucleoside-diphosphate reductase alpha chain
MDTATTFVFDFPVKSPKSNKYQKDITAAECLEHWSTVKTNFTEHNPSVTIYVGENEWFETGNWILKNWDKVGGLSFFPKTDSVYQLAPYEEIDEKKYEEMMERFKHVDYAKIMTYEKEDNTQGSHELACAGGVCEI